MDKIFKCHHINPPCVGMASIVTVWNYLAHIMLHELNCHNIGNSRGSVDGIKSHICFII